MGKLIANNNKSFTFPVYNNIRNDVTIISTSLQCLLNFGHTHQIK